MIMKKVSYKTISLGEFEKMITKEERSELFKTAQLLEPMGYGFWISYNKNPDTNELEAFVDNGFDIHGIGNESILQKISDFEKNKFITVEELLKRYGLYEFGSKYPEFHKYFNNKVEIIEGLITETKITFKKGVTTYICHTNYYPQFKQYCSLIDRSTPKKPFFTRVPCGTRSEEKAYPKLAGYIATCLCDKQNKILKGV